MIEPFYVRKGVVIYCARWQDVYSSLDQSGATVVLSDVPYGIKYRSNHNSGRKASEWLKVEWIPDHNFDPIEGDDQPFDPAPLLCARTVMLFGANYYASRLPDSRCWITWDKREHVAPDDAADCEYIWTNLDKPSRIYRHLWRGLVRRGEENVSRQPKYHPHQKPVALLRWLLEYADVSTDDIIIDPYMGSGSTLVAARRLGLRAIGVEIDPGYCAAAVKRLKQPEIAPLVDATPVEQLGPLFADDA